LKSAQGFTRANKTIKNIEDIDVLNRSVDLDFKRTTKTPGANAVGLRDGRDG